MRPAFDEYFMEMAKVAATRATCDRKHVGAVIVVKGCLVSTGYNGAPRGLPHCDSQGHELVEFIAQPIVEQAEDGFSRATGPVVGRKSCIRTIHAEMNAIVQAAKNGVGIDGGTLYTTASCCYDCAKVVINAGILRVIALEPYMSRYGKSGDVAALFESACVDSRILNAPACSKAGVFSCSRDAGHLGHCRV